MESKVRIRIDHSPESETLSDWPPSDMASSPERLREWLKMFVAVGRWENVEECERLLFASLGEPHERCAALIQSGDRWWRKKGDLVRARNRYREAIQQDRMSERAQARLRSIAHELGQRRVQPFRPDSDSDESGSATSDSATSDSATSDSATSDSATSDSATSDSATSDSADVDERHPLSLLPPDEQ